MELCDRTAHELNQLQTAGEVSAREIVQSVLDRIDACEAGVRAYNTLTPEAALAAADNIDQRRSAGETLGPLAGIPLGLKDNLCTKGTKTTCSSQILRDFVPPYNATVVDKVLAAGMIPVGKTNLDEFAMGSSTENSGFAPSCNPWDTTRVPGGSSGGSAAAVAAGECVLALGSDTGGSIRQPAAFCGVVGMKPTYGRVSRYGLVAFASSLDQIGPFARDIRDTALLLETISGHDRRDGTSIREDVPDYTTDLENGVQGWKIGVPREYFVDGLDPEVKQAVDQALKTYEDLGAEIVDISLPHTDYGISVYYVICTAEASSNLARYDGVVFSSRTAEPVDDIVDMFRKTRSEGFGDEVKRRIMLGTYVLSAGYFDAYYRKAQRVRTLVKRDFDTAFADVDVILTPTTPTPAFQQGANTDDPIQMYLSDVFTVCTPLAGIAGLSQTCGFSSDGLPLGVQLIGNVFEEGKLLRCARAFEAATDWHTRRPPLATATA